MARNLSGNDDQEYEMCYVFNAVDGKEDEEGFENVVLNVKECAVNVRRMGITNILNLRQAIGMLKRMRLVKLNKGQ